jgi:hypothetical protein
VVEAMPEEVKPCLGYEIQCWIVYPCLHRKKSIGEPRYTSSDIDTQNQCVVQISKEQHCVGDRKNCASLSPVGVVTCQAQNAAGGLHQYDELLVKKVAAVFLEKAEQTHNEVEQVKSRYSCHKSYEWYANMA